MSSAWRFPDWLQGREVAQYMQFTGRQGRVIVAYVGQREADGSQVVLAMLRRGEADAAVVSEADGANPAGSEQSQGQTVQLCPVCGGDLGFHGVVLGGCATPIHGSAPVQRASLTTLVPVSRVDEWAGDGRLRGLADRSGPSGCIWLVDRKGGWNRPALIFCADGADPRGLLGVAPFSDGAFIEQIREHVGWDSVVALVAAHGVLAQSLPRFLDAIVLRVDDNTCKVVKNRVGPVGLLGRVINEEVAA